MKVTLPVDTKQRRLVAYLRSNQVGIGYSKQLPILVGIALLILAVATDRFGIQVGGFNLRTELIVGILIAVVAAVRSGVTGVLRLVRSAGVVEYCLVTWLLLSFVSSALFSPMRAQSLKLTVLIAGFVVLYGVGFALLRSARLVTWAALTWIAVGSLVAVIGLVNALLYTVFGRSEGVTLEGNYQGNIFSLTPKIHSTMWEPNIFGSFALSVGILALALTCAPEFGSSKRLWLLRLATVAAFCGVMLSMTRTLWLVMPVTLLLFIAVIFWRKVVRSPRLLLWLLAPAILGTLIGLGVGYSMPTTSIVVTKPLTPAETQSITDRALNRGGGSSVNSGQSSAGTTTSAMNERLDTLSNPAEISSLVGRKRIYLRALKGIGEKPVLGWGTGSFAAYDDGGDKWVGNLELHILFDTGIVGLLLLAIAVLLPVWRGLKPLRANPVNWGTVQFIMLGLLVGGVGLLMAYQTTEGLWLGFTWVFLSLLVMASRYLPAPSSNPSTR